ncbi:globin domain-containing protein [Streptomyces sp. NPDC051940]|uniref:globin domain-containing protein n=1 Tax=Streptomyces sp. NPDC051940 TaxID=3155675 RepID=UPI00344582D2
MTDSDLIRASFARIERRADHVAKYFYSHLFAANPGVRAMFPADMSEQRDRLFAALTQVVQRLEDPGLPEFLEALGRDHRKFGAKPEHYTAVGQSLIAALRFGAQMTWDEPTEQAWLAAYGVLAEAMIRGSESAERQGDPPYWEAIVLYHARQGRDNAKLTLLPERDFPFTAGQFTSVEAPALRPQVWRPYTIACAPRTDNTIDLHVSRIDGGLLSPALIDEVREGDTLRLGPPSGTTVLASGSTRPATFIAAGTGWATIRALLEEWLRGIPPTQVRAFVAARSPEHLYDEEAIRAVAETHPWLNLRTITAQPGESVAMAWRRLAAALTSYADWPAQDVYVSGPPGFIVAVRELLLTHGAAPERLAHDLVPLPTQGGRAPGHTEWFLNPPQPRWINPADRDPWAGPHGGPRPRAGSEREQGGHHPGA